MHLSLSLSQLLLNLKARHHVPSLYASFYWLIIFLPDVGLFFPASWASAVFRFTFECFLFLAFLAALYEQPHLPTIHVFNHGNSITIATRINPLSLPAEMADPPEAFLCFNEAETPWETTEKLMKTSALKKLQKLSFLISREVVTSMED